MGGVPMEADDGILGVMIGGGEEEEEEMWQQS